MHNPVKRKYGQEYVVPIPIIPHMAGMFEDASRCRSADLEPSLVSTYTSQATRLSKFSASNTLMKCSKASSLKLQVPVKEQGGCPT